MTVTYEQIQGQPNNLKPMPISEVIKLKVGGKVYIWWAKDGDYEDVRVNGVETVEGVQDMGGPEPGYYGICLSIDGGDIDLMTKTMDPIDLAVNYTDWSNRGDVYFYYPPEPNPHQDEKARLREIVARGKEAEQALRDLTPCYDQKVPVGDGWVVLTVEEYLKYVEDGIVCDAEYGYGIPGKGGLCSMEEETRIHPSESPENIPWDATHVLWRSGE